MVDNPMNTIVIPSNSSRSPSGHSHRRSLRHYDYGMRAVFAVLVQAGRPEAEEASAGAAAASFFANGERRTKTTIWVCLKMLCTPKPNGFHDHYPY